MRCLVCGLMLLLAGCGDTRPERAQNRPEVFDVRLAAAVPRPPGFRLSERHDQVAHAIADGAVAVVALTLVRDPRAEIGPVNADEIQQWYADRLRLGGWELVEPGRWRRSDRDERFALNTGRSDKELIISTRFWRGLSARGD